MPLPSLWGQSAGGDPVAADEETPVDVSGPLKIAKLLWKANAKSAAGTLARSIDTALERDALDVLRDGLAPLRDEMAAVVDGGDVADPRLPPSLAALILLGEAEPAQRVAPLLARLEAEDRELLWKLWWKNDPRTATLYFAQRLRSRSTELDNGAWQNAFIREAIRADRQAASRILLDAWPQLSDAQRLAAIEPLTAAPASMQLLLDAVAAGTVSKDLLNANQLRKWLAVEDPQLTDKIESIWGRVRRTEDADRAQLVARTLQRLNSGVQGSASRGEQIFQRVCSQCHVLYDKGFEVGPNITNNGRGSLQQLVSNVLDPSLVIGEAFQAKTVLTVDGEVVSGLVVGETDRYLKLKIQGGKTVEFDKDDLEQVKESSQSLMPEGVETQMTEQQLFDLFAFLALARPLGAANNELISGTPDEFVQP